MAQANTQQAKTQFGYRRHPDQDRAARIAAEHPVVVVGAGPVGLSLAIDLAQRGQRVVLLDDADRIGEGSRAICFSKRSLEYLGPARRRPAHGRQGRGLERRQDLPRRLAALPVQPAAGARATSGRPSSTCSSSTPRPIWSIASSELPAIDLRWRNKVIGARTAQRSRRADDRRRRTAPIGCTRDYVVACDGARSSLRQMVGADFRGPGVRGSVPDRRRQDDGGIPDRALVLVRSAVPCRPLGAAAQAARRCLAHRPAAQPLRRSRDREAAGERAAADRAHARP